MFLALATSKCKQSNAANHCYMRERTGIEKETSPIAEILYHHPETAVPGEPHFSENLENPSQQLAKSYTMCAHIGVWSPNLPQKWVQLL